MKHFFLRGHFLALCTRISNSVVLVGFYYGFLTTFSIRSSYLLSLRDRVMEEGTEKEVSAITGFLMGQLMMFVSIYYAPLHLALNRPHTITVLVLPYLLFHLFSNKGEDEILLYYGSTPRNAMRNLSVQCVFLNNFVFPLFNHFILPSATLARLVNIYMFRCKNKMLFVTSSFVGWLIGYILFMKWARLVLFWIQEIGIRLNPRKKRYFLFKWREYMTIMFTSLFFIPCAYHLGRMPSPIFTPKWRTTISEIECEEDEEEGPSPCSEEEEDTDTIDKREEIRVNGEEKTKDEFHKESPVYEVSTYQENGEFGNEEQNEKTDFCFKEPVVTFLFDYKLWSSHPCRYLKMPRSEYGVAIRNAMSQYFFYTCPSDGKQRISFTYPPSLSTFSEMIEQKMSLCGTNKLSHEDQYEDWVYQNEQKKNNLSNELISRTKALEKGFLLPDILEKRIRFCDDENEKDYFIKRIDPLLSGPARGRIRKYQYQNRSEKGKSLVYPYRMRNSLFPNQKAKMGINTSWVNSIYSLLSINSNYPRELEHQKNRLELDRESLMNSITQIANLNPFYIASMRTMHKWYRERYSKAKREAFIFQLDAIRIDPNDHYRKIMINLEKIIQFQERSTPEQENLETILNEIEEMEGPNERDKILNKIEEMEVPNEREEIRKEISRWLYEWVTEARLFLPRNQEEADKDREAEIRSRRGIGVVLHRYTKDTKEKDDDDEDGHDDDDSITTDTNTKKTTKKTAKSDEGEEKSDEGEERSDEGEERRVEYIQYYRKPDFCRANIKGSMIRAQRRKAVAAWKIFQARARSPLFVDRVHTKNVLFSLFDDILAMSNLFLSFFRNLVRRKEKWQISDLEKTKEEEKIKEQEEKIKEQEEKTNFDLFIVMRDQTAISIEEMPLNLLMNSDAQRSRSVLLVIFAFLRKQIVLPSLIIAKNIGRMLFFQKPEWDEDWRDWKREIHIRCTLLGIQVPEEDWPADWLDEGIQIKIRFPFHLKPWREAKSDLDSVKDDPCFLTLFGTQSKRPFGPIIKRPSFFKPIYEELKKKMRKAAEKFPLIKGFQEKIKRMKEGEKQDFLFKLRKGKVDEPTENGKYFQKNNKILHESTTEIGCMNWKNNSLIEIEKQMKDFSDRTITIKKKIEQITKDKKEIVLTCDGQRSESKKDIWKIFQRKIIRLIRKSPNFMKSFIEKIYIKILLWIMKVPKIINSLFFLESKKKMINTSIYKDEVNQEGIDERDKNTMNFFDTKRKWFSNPNIRKNSKIFYDSSSLSQAYVFYKLSQSPLLNKYHLRSLLQYEGAYPFIKEKIKDYCMTRGIFDWKSRHKKIPKSRIIEWKNWLKGHYQYNLSQTKWSQLIAKKWRKKINQRCRMQKKDSITSDSYKKEKDPLIHYLNEEGDSLIKKQATKLQKNYKYDLLSHEYMNYDDRKDLAIYGSRLQVNVGRKIPSNFNTVKSESFYGLVSIALSDYLEEGDMRQNLDRKYFDCRRILHFSQDINIDRKNSYIEAWTNTHIGPKNRKAAKKIEKKWKQEASFYIPIQKRRKPKNGKESEPSNGKESKPKNGKESEPSNGKESKPKKGKEHLFNWMGMNQVKMNQVEMNQLEMHQEGVYGTISKSNIESWFFPEFVLLFDAYKIKPWIVPIRKLITDLVFHKMEFYRRFTKEEKKRIEDLKRPILPQKIKLKGTSGTLVKQRDLTKDVIKYSMYRRLKRDLQKQYYPELMRKRGETEKEATLKKKRTRKQDVKETLKEAACDLFLRKRGGLLYQWKNYDSSCVSRNTNKKIKMVLRTLFKEYGLLSALLLKRDDPIEFTLIAMSFIKTGKISLRLMKMAKNILLPELIRDGQLDIEPFALSQKGGGVIAGRAIIYQIISISLAEKNKHQTKRYGNMVVTGDRNSYDFLIPENILSPRPRRELRILMCFNSRNRNITDRNTLFCNENKIRNSGQFVNQDKHLNTDAKKFSKYKFFLWPNYRLEDLACMNRYWFDTNNGSRFSMSRIHMYPQF
uniref:hypothetical protein RF1 n=1 Tax=Anarthria humilis TaxID=198286 RepID=UPI001F12BC69|nr:hypothetical protein RF1 [Anarthria humilis]YP_010290329.1 hypothetical protein RF1 [Anarthria humilis]YP_010290354.1 hypothetical protein RF1 [Anarthria humilis]ULQ64082.1 hypothetical protein RF1 [Anarthria humilis]ULQ64095.1 hypothetical protein RF1 [Anarthria humilis]ULQ64120.1 hypothetical protein RF1 [Anarthria humilis]